MFHHKHHDKDHHGHHKHHDKDHAEVVETTSATSTTTTGASTVGTGAGAHVERHTNAPALVEEKVHQKQNVDVQNVLTRDVEKTEVHQITQPIHETQSMPVQHHERVLPEKVIEKNMGHAVPAQAVPAARRVDTGTEVNVVEHAPIVQERVHKKIIEDVQPVVYRDVIQPHHVVVKQPIHEHIVEAPVVIQQTAPVVESRSGLVSGLPPTNVNTRTEDIDRTVMQTKNSTLPATTTTGGMAAGGQQMSGAATGGVVHQVFKGETIQDARMTAQTGGAMPGGALGGGGTQHNADDRSHLPKGTTVGTGLNTGEHGPTGLGRREAKKAEHEIEKGVGNVNLDGRDRAVDLQAK